MSKILIIRREHPNEVSAFLLAKQIVDYLKREGHDVTLETVPFEATILGCGIRDYSRLSHKFYYPELLSLWLDEVFKRNKGSTPISLHNQRYVGNIPPEEDTYLCGPSTYPHPDYTRAVIEIAAVFKPVTNPKILKISKTYRESKNPYYSRYRPEYFEQVVDVKASRERGLMGDGIMRKIVSEIHRYMSVYVHSKSYSYTAKW